MPWLHVTFIVDGNYINHLVLPSLLLKQAIIKTLLNFAPPCRPVLSTEETLSLKRTFLSSFLVGIYLALPQRLDWISRNLSTSTARRNEKPSSDGGLGF
jgi:hypothetical protein